ncbi:AMP-binding protein [Salinibacterium sp. ZJ454]|uniref:class I adenylate-forming enzyme family protein n=1 Tax=Salinibacterium sp. ZJ454 TaxID=2708339 RepID=UPI00142474E1|nr:AMP-binding protein [Salinibacterium sp. ZJ454]
MTAGTELSMGRLMAELSRHGDRPALAWPGGELSYNDLLARSRRLADALRGLGLRPGQAVAFLLPNSDTIVTCYVACALSGFVGVPLGTRLKADDFVHQLADSSVLAVVFAEEFAETVSELRTRSPQVQHWIAAGACSRSSVAGAPLFEELLAAASDAPPDHTPAPRDPFCVMYTGGTTGASKAAVQTHQGWASCVLDTVEELGYEAGDRHVAVLPMTHAAWFTVAAMLHAGGLTHILPRWNAAEMLQLVQRERLTKLHVIPSLLGDLLAVPEIDTTELSSVQLLTLAGSPIPLEMYRRATALFGPIIGNIYGLTEAAGPVTYLMPRELDEKTLPSVGHVGRYCEVGIVDDDALLVEAGTVGEVVLRGPQVTPGYLNRPEENQKAFRDGWFFTGDLGYLDDSSFLFVIDRKKDMIKTGGLNVYPKEIEEVLYAQAGVREAAVVGVPHPRWIESVVAVVVVDPGQYGPTPDELESACRRLLAGYKVPKEIHLLESLPRTRFGKFDKVALRKAFSPS